MNRADATALQELPGVGPVLAGRIVEHRTRTPFTSVDELDDVPGIGPALMADLRARVRV
ncbi:ComEA family DNA-binding protein [Cellulomonas iranensis]|uniref:ComEA family DNA-binding protein n=1 Tax=Cellulomonas iranensis TaxID=76862 RepID=UPI0023E413E0|nr:helix-hairpin-helix domain-containing protein [Cellulomonas iranensis]